MAKTFVLYNPLSSLKKGKEKAENLIKKLESESKEVVATDITGIKDYPEFFKGVEKEDSIIIVGGDGTLCRFANDIYDIDPPCDVFYFATGSGNDFMRDVAGNPEYDEPFKVNDFIKDLPTVTVNGKTYRFLNGIGFGIDGYCCEVGDKMRDEGKEKINYTSIAIKGLLFHYKRTNAVINVDGTEHQFKKVWLAPVMVGKYYGGGMNPCPGQKREDRKDHVSCCVMHSGGKIRTLLAFPNIFKGEHVKYTKMVNLFQGKNIKVTFEEPRALQIDGETILGVTEYEVKIPE